MFDIKITDKNYRRDLLSRLMTIKENLEDGMSPARVCKLIQEQIDEINSQS